MKILQKKKKKYYEKKTTNQDGMSPVKRHPRPLEAREGCKKWLRNVSPMQVEWKYWDYENGEKTRNILCCQRNDENHNDKRTQNNA